MQNSKGHVQIGGMLGIGDFREIAVIMHGEILKGIPFVVLVTSSQPDTTGHEVSMD